MKLQVFLALSLDGYMAGENDDLSWLATCASESPKETGYADLMARVDTILIGRVTYEISLGFPEWPFSGKRVCVMTSRKFTPKHGEIFVSGTFDEVIGELKRQGAESVYVDGGAVVRQALKAGAVDSMTLSVVPVVLGKGKPLFDETVPKSEWELIRSRRFKSGMVQATYFPRPRKFA